MSEEKKETEKCIMCGIDTGIVKQKPIQDRLAYIEGAGQMGSKCFLDFYKKVHIKDGDTEQKP